MSPQRLLQGLEADLARISDALSKGYPASMVGYAQAVLFCDRLRRGEQGPGMHQPIMVTGTYGRDMRGRLFANVAGLVPTRQWVAVWFAFVRKPAETRFIRVALRRRYRCMEYIDVVYFLRDLRPEDEIWPSDTSPPIAAIDAKQDPATIPWPPDESGFECLTAVEDLDGRISNFLPLEHFDGQVLP